MEEYVNTGNLLARGRRRIRLFFRKHSTPPNRVGLWSLRALVPQFAQ